MRRRDFVLRVLQGAGATAVGGVVWGGFLQETKAAPLVLRPPGALPESDFLRSCIRCGLCVEACPYDSLALAAPGDNKPLGMPNFTPRQTPCYLCEDIPCAVACPTGALDRTAVSREVNGQQELDVELARMGIAVVDRDSCIAYWGLRCEACYRVCPLIDRAITLELARNPRTGGHAFTRPVVHVDACTGCGLCEHACVTEKAAIKVLPYEVALGKVGSNYIKGWEEQDEERLRDLPTDLTTETELSKRDPMDYLNADDLQDE
jgi:ferredoxin-type protein NapG